MNNTDNKQLEEMRKNVQEKIKERHEDRELGVKSKNINKSNEKLKIEENKKKLSKKNVNNKKNNNKNIKNKQQNDNNKYVKSKKSKKKAKNISIGIIILTILIFVAYSTVGRGYIEDIKREDFIKMLEPISEDVYKKYGIYPSVTISRAAIESNWGKSELSKESFNLFGIKADKSWHGRTISMDTKEGYDKVEKAEFRKYRSYKESIYDYGKFLKENKRYSKMGLFKAKNAKEQAQVLEDAGYATKENSKGELVYADVLINLMDKYELNKIDNKYIEK